MFTPKSNFLRVIYSIINLNQSSFVSLVVLVSRVWYWSILHRILKLYTYAFKKKFVLFVALLNQTIINSLGVHYRHQQIQSNWLFSSEYVNEFLERKMRTTEVGGPNPFATKRQWMVRETKPQQLLSLANICE